MPFEHLSETAEEASSSEPATNPFLSELCEEQQTVDRATDAPLDTAVEKHLLLETARANISKDKHYREFEENIEIFVQRDLPDSEVATSLANIRRFFDDSAASTLDDKLLTNLAQQVAQIAAHPESIDQGRHNTCTAHTLEVRAYRRAPSTATALVADIALDNRFQTRDGTIISLDQESLKPDDESRARLPRNGKRSFASQLFAITAINVYWLRETTSPMNGEPVVKGAFRFAQLEKFRGFSMRNPEGPGSVTFDLGERVLDMRQSPPAAILDKPYVDPAKLEEIYREITGTDDSDFIFTTEGSGMPGLAPVSTGEELVGKLQAMESQGKLPAVFIVHTNNDPWNEFPGTWHAINLTGYNEDTGKIAVSNQNGSRSDRKLNPDTLITAGEGTKNRVPPSFWMRQD